MAISQQKQSKSLPRVDRSCSTVIESVKRIENRRHTDAGDVVRWIPVSKPVSKAKRYPFVTQDSIEEESVFEDEDAIRKKDRCQIICEDQERSRSQVARSRKNSEMFYARARDSIVTMEHSKYPTTRCHSAGATCSRIKDKYPRSSLSPKPIRERRHTDTTLDSPRWARSPDSSRDDIFRFNEPSQKRNSASVGSTPTGGCRHSSSGITQRIRDLYDFKVETEWPRKVRHPPRSNVWISKSRSEEEEEYRSLPGTLEIDDKSFAGKSKNPEPPNLLLDEEEREERLRRFHEKLRFSEDLGQPFDRREKRIRSDEYGSNHRAPLDEKAKSSAGREYLSRLSWVSYDEIDQIKRTSRVSDASYVSIDVFERGVEVPPRRAFSQGDETTSSSKTPPTPPTTPLTKEFTERVNFGSQRIRRQKPEREGSKFKVYLV